MIGGLGIFLLGMIIMTEGLHALAGKTMRDALMKFTSSPLSGAITGACSTAILQSSSATTVAAVGFVGAGLIGFSESLGVIFGANIGTTITGWLVVLFGFKLKLSYLLLPLLLTGVLLKLFNKGKVGVIGFALAGFSLIFVGIAMMQQGMVNVESIVTPDFFPPDTWVGRIQLLLIGILITMVIQSSSAGVASALTALYAGAINFNQAAALVIGMDVGTTVTAALATIGGSVSARRTGFSHVIYNVITACGALLLLTPYTKYALQFDPNIFVENGEMALVVFHSLFNLLGVIIVLPFTRQFAQLIIYIFKDDNTPYSDNFDPALLKEPEVALTAILSATKQQLIELMNYIEALLSHKNVDQMFDFTNMQIALDSTQDYIDSIHLQPSDKSSWQELLGMIHVLDHMQRVHERCTENVNLNSRVHHIDEVNNLAKEVKDAIALMATDIKADQLNKTHKLASTTRKKLASLAEPVRHTIMTDIAQGKITVPEANQQLDVIKWLQRVCNHFERITYHLAKLEA